MVWNVHVKALWITHFRIYGTKAKVTRDFQTRYPNHQITLEEGSAI